MDQLELDNGLRLVVYRLPHRNCVSVNLRVDAGARCEAEQQSGLAHLVEHLLFQGTRRWPNSYLLTSQVESLGGELWGATHAEYTSFWLNVPHAYLSQALPIFADMMRSPLFAMQSIENEKEVVFDELTEVNEEGWQQVQLLLDKALWPDHPLGRPLLGREETIQTLRKDDVQAFFTQHYAPNRMVAAVVGDVQLEETITLFDCVWGDWSTNLPLTIHTLPRDHSPMPFVRQERDDGMLHLIFGFKTPPLDHPEVAVHTILRTLLGEGMSSRLYSALRGDSGLCYSIDGDVDELRHACVLTFYLATQPEQILEVFRKVRQIFHSLGSGEISPDDLEHSRKQSIGQLMMKADHTRFHARQLSLGVFLTGHALGVDEQIAQLESVDLDDLRRVARETLHPANTHAAIVGPLDEQTWQQCREIITA